MAEESDNWPSRNFYLTAGEQKYKTIKPEFLRDLANFDDT